MAKKNRPNAPFQKDPYQPVEQDPADETEMAFDDDQTDEPVEDVVTPPSLNLSAAIPQDDFFSQPIPQEVVLAPVAVTTFEEKIQAIRDRNDPREMGVMARLMHYVNVMNPLKPMTNERGGFEQTQLFLTYRAILAAPEEAVEALLDVVVLFFKEYGGADQALGWNVNRFPQYMQGGNDVALSFHNLNRLFQVIAKEVHPQRVLKQVSIEKALLGFPEDQVIKVSNYLSI